MQPSLRKLLNRLATGIQQIGYWYTDATFLSQPAIPVDSLIKAGSHHGELPSVSSLPFDSNAIVKSEGVEGNLGTYLCVHCGKEWHEVVGRSTRGAARARSESEPGQYETLRGASAPPPAR
jgi:hypothetical protein